MFDELQSQFIEPFLNFELFLSLLHAVIKIFQNLLPWNCVEIRAAIEERDYWYRRQKWMPHNVFIGTHLRKLKNIVTGLIRKHKKHHYARKLDLI
jgi:hypothetical protein